MDQILSLPFGVAWAVLYVIVFVRTNATYWLGRGLTAGAGRSRRLAERLERPGPARRIARAQRILDRWGPFAIVLTFLTVGLQTAVNLAAGLGRMHLRYYLPATAVGSVIWSFVYATVGLAAFDLWFEHLSGEPWVWAAVAAVVIAVVVRVLLLRRTRQRMAAGPTAAVSKAAHDVGGPGSVAGGGSSGDSLDGAAQCGADPERSET